MAEIKIKNIDKFYAVLLLYEKPRHGYDLTKSIMERLKTKTGPGEIYPFLRKMQKNRLIAVKSSGKRARKNYALTKKGKVFAKSLIERFGALIELAIEPKITVCAHCGCKVYGPGHAETIRGKKLRFCCRHCAASLKKTKH